MTTYVYKPVITGRTATFAGTEIGPAGVSYSVDKPALNKFVPTDLERYVDGVYSVSNLVRPDPTAITNQEVADARALLLSAGASYEVLGIETAVSTVGVAATFTTLTAANSVATTGFLQLSSGGVHGLTTGTSLAGKKLYVTWTGGTGVSGLYDIKSVDSTLIITLDTTSTGFAGMGTAVVSVVGTAIPLYTGTVYANSMGTLGELSIEALWSHTSSANNKTITVDFGGTTFGAYVTPTTVASTVYEKEIINRAAAVQVSSALTSAGSGSIAGALVAGTVDTTADCALVVSGTIATANEVMTLETLSCKIEV